MQVIHLSSRLILITCLIAGCSPSSDNPSTATTTWQDGDNREVWSRGGPIAGAAEDCLELARRYADGTQFNRPVCIGDIGGEQDEQVNNAWLTLGPNGADRAAFERFRARRLTRFQSATSVANDPNAPLGPTQTQLFRDEFTDCWDTYDSLRGLNASPKARDAFLTYMELLYPNR